MIKAGDVVQLKSGGPKMTVDWHELLEQLDPGHDELATAIGQGALHVVCETSSTSRGR